MQHCSVGWRDVEGVLLQVSTSKRRGGRVVRRCWVNFQCRGVLLIWIKVGQGHIVLAVGACEGCLDSFLSSILLFSLSLSERWPDID